MAKKKEMKAKQASGAASAQTTAQKKKSHGWIGWLIPIAYIVIFFFASILFEGGFALIGNLFSGSGNAFPFIFAVALPIQLVFSVFTIINASRIQKKTAIIPAIFAPLVIFGGIIIAFSNSPYDYWYYGTAIACLIAIILNCISAINYFNYLTTRPVPNFFRREGANNEK